MSNPGWYPDATSDGEYERWWDGTSWLDETRPPGGPGVIPGMPGPDADDELVAAALAAGPTPALAVGRPRATGVVGPGDKIRETTASLKMAVLIWALLTGVGAVFIAFNSDSEMAIVAGWVAAVGLLVWIGWSTAAAISAIGAGVAELLERDG